MHATICEKPVCKPFISGHSLVAYSCYFIGNNAYGLLQKDKRSISIVRRNKKQFGHCYNVNGVCKSFGLTIWQAFYKMTKYQKRVSVGNRCFIAFFFIFRLFCFCRGTEPMSVSFLYIMLQIFVFCNRKNSCSLPTTEMVQALPASS